MRQRPGTAKQCRLQSTPIMPPTNTINHSSKPRAHDSLCLDLVERRALAHQLVPTVNRHERPAKR